MSSFMTLGQIEHALMNDPPRRRFIIPRLLPAGPVLLYGASSSGKTGIAIRTALAVSAGLAWADRMATSGSVLYVAGEDIEGTKERMVGAARALGLNPANLPFAIMEGPSEGLVSNVARLAILSAAKMLAKQTGRETALIVVDTLAACFGPKSQDDATAASEFMNNVDRTARELACSFLSVHHTGKDTSAGMRGSQVFFDRADAVLRVKRGQGATSFVTVEKMRNSSPDDRFAFDIEGTPVATSGGVISVQTIQSLRVLGAETETKEESQERRAETIKTQMLGVLTRLSASGQTDMSAWQEACYSLWRDKSSDTRRKVFSKNRNALQAEGQISVHGEFVTVTVTAKSMVTGLVTPSPNEPVTVTVTAPPSKKGDEGDRRTRGQASFSKADSTEVQSQSVRTSGSVERPNGLSLGAGIEDPATTCGAGDDDGDVSHSTGRTRDAA
ncbi:helicase RepA family protein [Aureimonas altamirensis]|uniref:AAA family ATPase n=1 Tax=Aureimonas altamirensis TaxID=370622 RepID=UPI001E32EAD8|nr:AAA family ATPase [Aureimonas altamirensis]UHD45524.1 helicase RepA family protein [Aureimonas altamirensis]